MLKFKKHWERVLSVYQQGGPKSTVSTRWAKVRIIVILVGYILRLPFLD